MTAPKRPRRIMIVGQPGSGKSSLAAALGKVAACPAVPSSDNPEAAALVERLRLASATEFR